MMQALRMFFAVMALWSGCCLQAQQKPLPPPPTQWVTDGAARLSPAVASQLNQRLAQFEQATGHQVLVWIGQSTDGVPLEEWAVRTFEAWKVGRKSKDDGVVLFLLVQDKKLRIEVGYGLEPQLPDLIASRIIQERIVPALRVGNWDAGVAGGVDGILSALGDKTASKASPMPQAKPMNKGSKWVPIIVGGLLLLLFLTNPSFALGLLFSMLSGGRGGGGGSDGGGWSGGGGRSGGGGASGSW